MPMNQNINHKEIDKNQIVDDPEIEALATSLAKTFDVSKEEIIPLVRKTKGKTMKEATAIMLKELQEFTTNKKSEVAFIVENIGVTINDAFSEYYDKY